MAKALFELASAAIRRRRLVVVVLTGLMAAGVGAAVASLCCVSERVCAGDSAQDATPHGLGVSARVITAAALIMIAVFGSFIAQAVPTIKMFGLGLGLGLATAVPLDATIVWMLVTPAALAVPGERAWRLPPRLHGILPDIEGHRVTRQLAATDTDHLDAAAPCVSSAR